MQSEKHTHVQKRKLRFIKKVVLLVSCFVLAFFGALTGTMLGTYGQNTGSNTTSHRLANDGNLTVSKQEADIASLTERVSPSVVSIISSAPDSGRSSMYQAAGTGMIVSKDGYVLTNKHVVNGARAVTIVTSTGTTYKDVSVTGTDPLNDIAFLKIPNVSNLPTVELGDSKTVRVGQQVVAIGNALGQYNNTVTSGIISGLGRPVQAGDEQGRAVENLSDLLQTDAAINSGNSGGPLLNLRGQVIGINTAVAADAQNIGFAIPIGSIKGALDGVLKTGTVSRAIMGVQYVTITPETKSEYNLPINQGDYVYGGNQPAVKSDGPADKAGIREKDILLKVNGEQIGAGKSISTLIGEYKPGDTVVITLQRDGKVQDVRVTLRKY